MTPAASTRWPAARWGSGDVLAYAVSGLLMVVAGELAGWSEMLLVPLSGLVVVRAGASPVGADLIDATNPFRHRIDVGIGVVEVPVTRVTSDTWTEKESGAHRGAAAAMVRESPVTGSGAGMLHTRHRETTHSSRLGVRRGRAHNGYLLVETLVAFRVWLGGVLVLLARAARRSSSAYSLIAGSMPSSPAYELGSGLKYLAHRPLRSWTGHLIPVGRSLGLSSEAWAWA